MSSTRPLIPLVRGAGAALGRRLTTDLSANLMRNSDQAWEILIFRQGSCETFIDKY